MVLPTRNRNPGGTSLWFYASMLLATILLLISISKQSKEISFVGTTTTTTTTTTQRKHNNLLPAKGEYRGSVVENYVLYNAKELGYDKTSPQPLGCAIFLNDVARPIYDKLMAFREELKDYKNRAAAFSLHNNVTDYGYIWRRTYATNSNCTQMV
jgi:hypothetical protein